MSTLHERIAQDLKESMKNRDQTAMSALRALKSAMTYASIEKGGAGSIPSEADALAVVRKQIKQRKDSVEQFSSGGRADLAAKEQSEIEVLERYLPAPMSGAEVEVLVAAVIAELGVTSKQQMGQVMKVLQERAGGRADGKTLSGAVAKRLA